MTRPPRSISVLVVAEDEITRLGLRVLLRNIPAVGAVTEARDRHEALGRAAEADYDVAVVDVRPASRPDGFAIIGELEALRPGTPFAVLAEDVAAAEEYCRTRRIKCSCSSRGRNSAGSLSGSIDRLAPVRGSGFDHAGPSGPATGDEDVVRLLTARERQVLSLVASGAASKEIAQSLGVSLRTVESHRARVCTKLGVRSVADLTKVAVKAGLALLDHNARW